MWLLILSLFLGPVEKCNSTIFGYAGDKLAGKQARYLRRPIDPERDIGIASRAIPLGSVVVIKMPGTPKHPGDRWTWAVVIDAGPWGRIRPRGSACPSHGRRRDDGTCWVNGAYELRACKKKHPTWGRRRLLGPECYSKGSHWNGCIDLAPETARRLGHGGWRKVWVFRTKLPRIPRRVLLQMWGGGEV
jgi:hypothetical protein